MKRFLLLAPGGVIFFLVMPDGPAVAQRYAPAGDTTAIYNYVDQLPALPGGSGNLALVKAVQQRLQLPAEVREGRVEGRVFVRFVVGVSGAVRQASVMQSLSPTCDAAALAAVRKLPRFVPGYYRGQAVATLLSVPVVFLSPRHIYTNNEATAAAQFPGRAGSLEKYLEKNQQLPEEVSLRDLRGRTVVRFVVQADGRIGATEVLKPLCGPCDDEALRLVRAMPRWRPAVGYDNQAVATYQSLTVSFAPPTTAGMPANVPETEIYSSVEQMPALPDGADIAAALLERLDYPAGGLGGQMQVSFVVEPDGRVTRPAVLKGFNSDLDEATLRAALRLPRFTPGRHRGQPVAVRLAVPLTIDIR